jgi:hypothetical protein
MAVAALIGGLAAQLSVEPSNDTYSLPAGRIPILEVSWVWSKAVGGEQE